jgi:hypothetical protein
MLGFGSPSESYKPVYIDDTRQWPVSSQGEIEIEFPDGHKGFKDFNLFGAGFCFQHGLEWRVAAQRLNFKNGLKQCFAVKFRHYKDWIEYDWKMEEELSLGVF